MPMDPVAFVGSRDPYYLNYRHPVEPDITMIPIVTRRVVWSGKNDRAIWVFADHFPIATNDHG